jgi:hypothetical protein
MQICKDYVGYMALQALDLLDQYILSVVLILQLMFVVEITHRV